MYSLEKDNTSNNFQKEKLLLLKIFWMMYVLFPFRLKGIAGAQNIIYYGVSMICFFIFLYRLSHIKVKRVYFLHFLFFIFIFIVLMTLSYIVPVIKNSLDFSYLSNYEYFLGRLIIMLGSVILVKGLFNYINLVVDSINLYVIFSIILLIPSLHSAYFNLVVIDSDAASRINELYSQDYYTRFGLQGYSGFGSTIMCSLAVLFCCYMMILNISKGEKTYPYVIRIIIALIGSALYGRSGFLISIIIIIITIFYMALFYGKIKLLLSSMVTALILAIVFILNADKLEQIDSIRWMFEGFFNYLNYGQFTTTSSNQLKGMYIHPSYQTFMSGDGYYTVGGLYYMNTDVGFLRPLLFWGIFGEILYYFLMIPPIIVLGKFLRNKNGGFLVCISIILLVMFEFKGETLLTFSSVLFALMGSILLDGYNSKQNKVEN